MNDLMNEGEFEGFLLSIGGLENGFYPDKPTIKRRGFFSIGDGWLSLVTELITKLIELGWDKCLTSRYASKERDDALVDFVNTVPFNFQAKR